MPRRLGELLVSQGLVSALEVEEALQAQVVFGGKLGTNLVELRRLDLDQLTAALSLQGGLPGATSTELESISKSTLALLPRALAEKHQCLPLVVAPNRRSATVASTAIHQAALDELAFTWNVRLQAKVAPELRILHWLERHYGVARKQRFLRSDVSVGQSERRGLVAPLVPPAAPAPAPQPVDTTLPELPPLPTTHTLASPEMEEVRRRVFGMSEDLSLDETPSAPSAPEAPETDDQELLLEEVVPSVPHFKVSETASQIAAASTREQIAEALLGYLRSRFAVGLVLLVRQELVLGWKGFSPSAGSEILENLALPLSAPSFFQQAFQNRAPVHTAPRPEGAAIQGRFFKLLGVEPPPEVFVAPVLIRDRVVSLVYAHPPPGKPLRPASTSGLATLALHAGTGFVRLIQRSKSPPSRSP